MKELALYILDIAQNSINAGAKNIEIEMNIDHKKDLLSIVINDDGCGMDKDFLNKVFDPFTTTRKERRVGLGLPLFKELAEQCGGNVVIKSSKGIGTCCTATFKLSSIDLVPLGDLPSTIISIIISDNSVDIVYTFKVDGKSFKFDTKEIRKILKNVKITEISVLNWILEYLKDNMKKIMEV
ncbi:ATP-binding protein [Thermoanaerobacterium sp. RBIITD]|uniref:ATP-binding protein n=1 Tax=Thermoanaerobacterium sp. RBIITD TaxID=1550240 RepID=UPI000BB6B498|nr:ATP-binding protein [Thermoanaerobacterium sp. RBIITD]SNX55137.1 Histidine kinase-, DNA gyrase B-, and HSP90-like ATPase [Thermoanaerobacterium sp. RBIITD]